MTEPRTWYALMHEPGPALAEGQRVSEHPGIGEHYAFLQAMAARGALVAAGPLLDVDGAGMTVLEASSLAEATEWAEREDQSVVAGVLSVRVRPWQVVMAPVAERVGGAGSEPTVA